MLPLFLDKKSKQHQEYNKKRFVCDVCYERFSAPTALNRHMLTCNSMTIEVYPKEKSFVSFDDKKLQNMLHQYQYWDMLILKQSKNSLIKKLI